MLLTVAVSAQTQRSGNDVARVMQQLQQVSAEKTRLQTENDALKKQLEEVKAKASKAGPDQGVVQQQKRELDASNARQKESAEAMEQLRTKMQDLIGKFRETATQLQTVEADREQLKAAIAVQEREYKSCVDRNAGLYFLSDEILRRLENRSVWSKLSEKEAFTRISRTRMENLIDDYRDRVEELRVSRKRVAAQ
jgi:chaperonin cofactor prefoldin